MWEGDIEKVNGRTAFDAMRQGDPIGKEIVDEYIKYLSVGIVDMINIFQPDILCIGGGISNERETLLAPVREFVAKEQYAMNSAKKTQVWPGRGWATTPASSAPLCWERKRKKCPWKWSVSACCLTAGKPPCTPCGVPGG